MFSLMMLSLRKLNNQMIEFICLNSKLLNKDTSTGFRRMIKKKMKKELNRYITQ